MKSLETKQDITEALKDSDPAVRLAAIQHPKAGMDPVMIAMKDKDEAVRAAAKTRLKELFDLLKTVTGHNCACVEEEE